jgi:arsenate reductase
MDPTIYHNPRCSTSRQTLEMMQAAGVEPKIVEYLKRPPSRAKLKDLLRKARLRPREAMRTNDPLYAELGLGDETLSDDALLDAMHANPALIQRPIVETSKGVRLCRPPERVHELL